MWRASSYRIATQLTIKLTVTEEDARVPLTQVVGGTSVDWQFEVLATSIHVGARAAAFAWLGLAYALPFRSARDPVHMARRGRAPRAGSS